MIHSDWHIHTEYSYDAIIPLNEIAENAKTTGLRYVGITDHVNSNDESFLSDLRASASAVKEAQRKHPFMILGAELTPIEKPLFDYIAKNKSSDGYIAPTGEVPYGIELAQTKEELRALGVRYTVGASHWRVDIPGGEILPPDLNADIKEWYRQQMWLACDERVTILGHPWYNGYGTWYADFSIIPRSMNADIAAALKENGKYVECNAHFFVNERPTEKFRHQYAEFLRELFEMGIPITYGSDNHYEYGDHRHIVETYLAKAGFTDGDISELSDSVLW